MSLKKIMSKKTINNRIILTCIGGPLKINEIKFLKNKSKFNNYVVGTDINKNITSKKFVDKFYITPKGNDNRYIKEMIRIVKKEKIDLIIPCSDEEALSLAKNKKKFNMINCMIAIDDYKKIRIFADKLKTYQFLKKAKIMTPKYYSANNFSDLKKKYNIFKNKNLDFVVKPSKSRGGRNVFVVYQKNIKTKIYNEDRETHISFENFVKKNNVSFKNLYPLIIMERLYKPTFDLDIFSNNGNLINCVLRRRIISNDPNAGHLIENKNKKFTNIAKKIVKYFQLSWLYDCDIMINKRNNPCILEINPRPSGSTSISLAGNIYLLDNILELNKSLKLSIFLIKRKKIMPNNINF